MNKIHPTAIIGDNVKLGTGNEILPYTIIMGPTEIGDNNIIGPNVVIGTPGQDTKNPRYDSSQCPIYIGSNNIIREFTSICKPCYDQETRVGNDIYIMQNAQISHDVLLEDKVVITMSCVLAGLCKVLEGANLAMAATIHQYSVIGQYSIVGTNSAVIKNIRPFVKYIPGKPLQVNSYAVKKYGFEPYRDEITRYVLEGAKPQSDAILKIVERYQKLHQDSKRDQY